MTELYLTLFIIVLLVIAFFYIKNFYYREMITWPNELSFKKYIAYFLPVLVKSFIALVLVIFIHNSLHDAHLLELSLFIFVFFLFSIFQSAFSISGFFNRNKHVYASFLEHFTMSSKLLERAMNTRSMKYFRGSNLLVKIGIIVVFLIIFIPNASLFITTNIIFFLFIALMIVLSLLQNNIIYFGLISLIIFQFNHEAVTITMLPPITIFLSYLVLVIGVILETRLERRMFLLINVMPVKRFNFNLGYDHVLSHKHVTIYQNVINHYYYVYYRKLGIVVVYHSNLDAKISYIVLNKMISYGRSYIASTANE